MVNQAVQVALANCRSQTASTTSTPSVVNQASPMAEIPGIDVQTSVPPPNPIVPTNTTTLIETPPRVISYERRCMTEEGEYLRDFMRLEPPTFEGRVVDPEAADRWLVSIKKKFIYANYPERVKVQCAMYMLAGPTYFLWK